MKVLIAESNACLSNIWKRHLKRYGVEVIQAFDQMTAMQDMRHVTFDAMIMNLRFPDANVLAMSDIATYRNPNIAIFLVTAERFFSDGSIFTLVPNARGFVNDQVAPDDLVAMVQHYAA